MMAQGVSAHVGKVRALRFVRGPAIPGDPALAPSARRLEADPQCYVLSGGYDGYVKSWTFPRLTLAAGFAADSAIIAADATDDCQVLVAGDAQGCAHFLCLELFAGA